MNFDKKEKKKLSSYTITAIRLNVDRKLKIHYRMQLII